MSSLTIQRSIVAQNSDHKPMKTDVPFSSKRIVRGKKELPSVSQKTDSIKQLTFSWFWRQADRDSLWIWLRRRGNQKYLKIPIIGPNPIGFVSKLECNDLFHQRKKEEIVVEWEIVAWKVSFWIQSVFLNVQNCNHQDSQQKWLCLALNTNKRFILKRLQLSQENYVNSRFQWLCRRGELCFIEVIEPWMLKCFPRRYSRGRIVTEHFLNHDQN